MVLVQGISGPPGFTIVPELSLRTSMLMEGVGDAPHLVIVVLPAVSVVVHGAKHARGNEALVNAQPSQSV